MRDTGDPNGSDRGWHMQYLGKAVSSKVSFWMHRVPCSVAVLLLAIAVVPVQARAQAAPAARVACPALLQHQFKRLQDEAPQDLCQYAGKVVLVVNTASYCGFTNQYEGLERLHARMASQGLVVMGFPSNDFEQESGDNKQIADFCFNTYAVKFPMFVKSNVTGKNANPLFAALGKANGTLPRWNFHKYLVDRKGRVVASYPGEVPPEDPRLMAQLQKALAEK